MSRFAEKARNTAVAAGLVLLPIVGYGVTEALTNNDKLSTFVDLGIFGAELAVYTVAALAFIGVLAKERFSSRKGSRRLS